MTNPSIAATIETVTGMDPRLLADRRTRVLVEQGAYLLGEVSERYGSPDHPRRWSGTVEAGALMCYHNGGLDGHTSVGPLGAGVPRNALLLARAINTAAGREVADPMLRAAVFVAACAHDHTQLCGRTLREEEGHGPERGDERLSADTARARTARVLPEAADLVHQCVMATAFDTYTGSQNVRYQQPASDSADRGVLAQEITAAADLMSLVMRRGPLSCLEHVCEALYLRQHGQLITTRLGAAAAEITDPARLRERIDADPELRAGFAAALAEQVGFFAGFTFSDRVIRQLCGAGVDALFPGRTANTASLREFADLLERGHSVQDLWRRARALAGYRDDERCSSPTWSN